MTPEEKNSGAEVRRSPSCERGRSQMRIGAWTQLQRRKRSTAVKLKDAAPKCRSARAQVAELKKWTACEPAGPLPCCARPWLERLTFSIMWWIDGLVISDAIDYGV